MYETLPFIRLRAAGVTLAAAMMISAGVARAGDATAAPQAPPPVPPVAGPAVAQPAPPGAESPILVFQPSSSVADVSAAQQLTQLVAARLRFMYGDDVKLVADLGTETIAQIAHRLGAHVYVGGSIEKVNGIYYADLQSRDATTNAVIAEQRFSMSTFDALPKDVALVSLIEPGPMIPNAHYVFIPLTDDATADDPNAKDAYLQVTQDDVIKHLTAKGITTALVPSMDPVDVRIDAGDLCRDNNATGVLVGHTWYKQDYKEGALKGGAKGLEKALVIVPIAGPIVAGMLNATTNAVAGAGGSDDKYVSHSVINMTLLSCEGKRVWSGSGMGDTQHFSDHNVASGQIGAIDLAVSTLVDNLSARH